MKTLHKMGWAPLCSVAFLERCSVPSYRPIICIPVYTILVTGREKIERDGLDEVWAMNTYHG